MLCVLFFDMVNGSLGLGQVMVLASIQGRGNSSIFISMGKVLVLVSIFCLFLEMGLFQGGFGVICYEVIKMGGVLEKEYQNGSLLFENELIWGLLVLGGDKSENGLF